MGYTIVSGNKPSSGQYPKIKIMEKYLSKCFNKIKYVLNFNMPKTKWEGAELERDFQISKQHLIIREKKNILMGCYLISSPTSK